MDAIGVEFVYECRSPELAGAMCSISTMYRQHRDTTTAHLTLRHRHLPRRRPQAPGGW